MKLLLITSILLTLFYQDLSAQTTSIPDTAFEQKLIQLGYDSDGIVNGQILSSDAANVFFLDISGSYNNRGSIQGLSGIEDFTNLSELNCDWNQITDLDCSLNSNLEQLLCSQNYITFLNTFGLNQLHTLDAASNQLTSIDVSSNLNLQNFFCSQNQLSSIDVTSNVNLKFFNCSLNLLSNVNINNNILLEDFDCFRNQITSLDISQNTQLKNLRSEYNLLSHLDLRNMPALEQVLTNNNLLDSISVGTSSSLLRLHCSNNQLTEVDLSACSSLEGFTALNNQLTHLNIQNGNNSNLYPFDVTNNASNLLICVDNRYIIPTTWIKDASATYSNSCRLTLTGMVKQDTNNNCVPDVNERLMHSQIIKITENANISYSTTNMDGAYFAGLDTGTHTLELIPSAPYWSACPPIQYTTTDSTYSLDTVNWALQASIECPLLVVDISAPFLRATGGGSYYTINYCNNGTAAANLPYVELSVDPFLNVLNSSIPIVSQTGNLFRFDLDTIQVGECGSFNVNVIADTAALLGQTHCSEAHIYPDSSCLPLWNGPILNASGQCSNDSIFFKLRNTGSNMLSASNYAIFEDDIIIRMTPFNLPGGDSTLVSIFADPGKTYRIQTNQVTGFPSILGSSTIYSAIEACNPLINGGFNTGFITQYYTGNSSPFVSVDCQQNIAAYDPNDKAAQPEGYGASHYIEANTPLKYRVRFQNTGTDTAFNIVILDTLSTHVDPTSLQMGASSHAYTWELSGAGILTVVFEDILLVDSNANEPLSHGFFTYNINQVADLANGSVINNQAAIYFDYNPPIFTNTTFHTIGENYVPIILNMEEAWVEAMQVHLYPNPTSGLVYMEQLSEEETQIKVLDNLGRVVLQQNTKDKTTTIDLNQFPQGLYYINIQQDKQVSTHKVVKY